MDRFEISTLRGYYGALLTSRQNDMLRLHYDEDLSFGEIAELYGVSRQAVSDSISKGEKALADYDLKLRLVTRDKTINAILDSIAVKDDDTIRKLDDIRRVLEE